MAWVTVGDWLRENKPMFEPLCVWIDYEILRTKGKKDSFKVSKEGMDISDPNLEDFFLFDGLVTSENYYMLVWDGKF